MSRDPIRAMSLEAFASLVKDVGLPIELEDFEQLIARGFLLPMEGGEDTFCALQLLGLSRYVRAVSRCQHPWLDPAEVADLDHLRHEMAHLTTLANRLSEGEGEAVRSEELEQLSLELEREAERHGSFGSLGVLLGWLRTEAIGELRGSVRACAELRAMAQALTELRYRSEMAETAPMGHTSISGFASRGLRTTQDMDAVDNLGLRSTMEMDSTSATAMPEGQPLSIGSDSPRVTAEMEAVERPPEGDDASDEEGAEEPGENPFDREKAPSTSSNKDLQNRLEALRNLDGRRARASSIGAKAIALAQKAKEDSSDASDEEEEPGVVPPPTTEEILPEEEDALESLFPEEEATALLQPGELPGAAPPEKKEDAEEPAESSPRQVEPEEAAKEPPAADPAISQMTMAEKIQELNQKREAYMRAQNWTGLVTLYEEGIELFEAQERQQVHLTLAKLYELKLQDSAQAFGNMTAAFMLGGPPAIQEKILEAMQRVDAGEDSPFEQWVEGLLQSNDLPDSSLALVHASWARHLRKSDPQRAFFSYASFLADAPESRASESTLALFEELGAGVESEELYALYDDILEQIKGSRSLALISEHAGMCALDGGDSERAIRYLSAAFGADPSRETVYHILAQLYEDAGRWSELAALHEARAVHDPSLADGMADALRAARSAELEHSDRSIEYYTSVLDGAPADTNARDRLMQIYMHHNRHAEAYAFLNRHVERLELPEHKVRLLQAMATIAQQHLHAPEEAVVHLEEALEVGGANRALLEGLISLRCETEQWGQALEAIDSLTESFELDAKARVKVWMVAAQAAHRGDFADKQRHYLEQVLSLDPGHEGARQALAEGS